MATQEEYDTKRQTVESLRVLRRELYAETLAGKTDAELDHRIAGLDAEEAKLKEEIAALYAAQGVEVDLSTVAVDSVPELPSDSVPPPSDPPPPAAPPVDPDVQGNVNDKRTPPSDPSDPTTVVPSTKTTK